MFFITSILSLLACHLDEDECRLPDFENKWLQVYLSEEPVTDCYKFLDDGYLLTSDGESVWPVGHWEATVHDCYVTINTDAGYFDLYYGDICFPVESDLGEFDACECQYDL